MTDDLRAFLDQAPLITETATFADGTDAAFEVELKRIDKPTLERIGQRSLKRSRNGTAEADIAMFRRLIRDHCILGWSGLTFRKVALLTSRNPAPDDPRLAQDVAFTPDNALALLESARGVVDGTTIAFADWLVERATEIAEREAQREAAAKND